MRGGVLAPPGVRPYAEFAPTPASAVERAQSLLTKLGRVRNSLLRAASEASELEVTDDAQGASLLQLVGRLGHAARGIAEFHWSLKSLETHLLMLAAVEAGRTVDADLSPKARRPR